MKQNLKNLYDDILSRKSLFKKCRDKYIYNRKTKKCIPLIGNCNLKVKKQNLNQESDGKIVKTEGKGNVYIISFPGKKEGQGFLLVPKEGKENYRDSLVTIVEGEARPQSIPGDVFNKVKSAYEKDAFCVSVLGTVPEEVTSKDVINSLSLDVSFTSGLDEYGLGSDDAVLYARDVNTFFLIEGDKDFSRCKSNSGIYQTRRKIRRY